MINQTPNQFVVRELAAFIPRDYRQAIIQQKELPSRTTGTALFADISGFTRLTRLLSRMLGRQKGAEAVLSHINPIYEETITHLHRYGGSAINFIGDGVLCWFDDDQGGSCERAISTALAIQKTMTQFASVPLADGEQIPLHIKIAIASGPASRVLVGDPSIRLLKTMAGETIHRVSQICTLTRSGEIAICAECAQLLGDTVNVVAAHHEEFVIIKTLEKEVLPTPWPNLDHSDLSLEQIRPWLHSSIFNHIQNGGTVWGDLRPVTPMMIRFNEPDFDRDPDAGEKLNAYISWVQRVVHQYGGSLIQFSVGDKGANLYAPFGAPIAHEDDIERALKAALALHNPPQDVAPPGGIQIGLSRGNVWTGACGASNRFTYGVMGDDVNLAARLMMKAVPGQTIVSERMVEKNRFNYRELGFFSYKGFPHQVKTFELIDQKERSEKFFTTNLLERSSELVEIKAAIQPIFDNRFAGVVTIWGDAGIGKSHLIHELSCNLDGPVAWLEGAFESVRQESLAPFKQIIRAYFNQTADQTYEENLDAFDRSMTRLIETLPSKDAQCEATQNELFRSKSILAAMVGLHWGGSLYEQLSPNLRFENQLSAFKNFVRAIGLIQPTIIHLDDAHWIDDDSKQMLLTLTRNVSDMPFVLILGSRYEGGRYPSVIDFSQEVTQTAFDLKELSKQGVASLTSQILNVDVSDSVVDQLAAKTNGNPLFVQQLALNLREEHRVTEIQQTAQFRLHSAEIKDMPESLNTVMVSRLDRLGQQVKDVIQTAAVLGREFEIKLLSRMLSDSQSNIGQCIDKAEEAQIWSPVADRRYHFRHVLMQEAAYGMQINVRLQTLHLNAAEAILAEYADDLDAHAGSLAFHFDLAKTYDQALHWYEIYAAQLSEQYANQEAIKAYTRALDLVPPTDLDKRFCLLRERAKIYGMIGNRIDQKVDVDHLIVLADQLNSHIHLSIAFFEAGNFFSRENDVKNSVEFLEKSLKAMGLVELQDLELTVNIYTTWARVSWQSGDFELAKEKLSIAYPISLLVNASLEASVLSALSVVHGISGDVESAIHYGERALKLHQETNNLHQQGITLNSLGIQARRKGEYSNAQEIYLKSLTMMREVGFRFGVSVVRNNLTLIWLEQGQYQKAENEIKRSIELSRDLGMLRNECWGLVFLSAIYVRLGEHRLGLETAELACQQLEECGDPDLEGYAMLYFGLALAGQRQWDKAKVALRKSVQIRNKLKQSNLATEPMAALIEIAMDELELDSVETEAEFISDRLNNDPNLSGPYEPFQVHYTLYRYLKKRNDDQAGSVLRRAHEKLLERAEKIDDPSMQQSYLENVAVHREIVEAARVLAVS